MFKKTRNNSAGNIVTSIILWVIFLSIVGYLVYQNIQNIPCRDPIHYKIGTLDPRFGVSESDFEKDIAQAGNIWSTAVGKTLFAYDPSGTLTINLIYDNRQAATQTEQVLNSNISQTSGVADSVKTQYTSLENSYNQAKESYDAALSQFNQAQTAYNTTVAYWNNKGGAPTAEYATLSAEKNILQSQRDALNAQAAQISSLADQINALIDKYNLLVAHINSNVSEINNNGIAGTQFEEGEYDSGPNGKVINIYQFDNQIFFIRVLAHEMGHSLGLIHNSNPDSIMNPVNSSTNLKPTAEDLADLDTVCGIK